MIIVKYSFISLERTHHLRLSRQPLLDELGYVDSAIVGKGVADELAQFVLVHLSADSINFEGRAYAAVQHKLHID